MSNWIVMVLVGATVAGLYLWVLRQAQVSGWHYPNFGISPSKSCPLTTPIEKNYFRSLSFIKKPPA